MDRGLSTAPATTAAGAFMMARWERWLQVRLPVAVAEKLKSDSSQIYRDRDAAAPDLAN
jgi:hypothetical protein